MSWYWYIIIIWVLLGFIGGQMYKFEPHDALIGLNRKSILYIIFSMIYGPMNIRGALKFNKNKLVCEDLKKQIKEDEERDMIARIAMLKREQRNKKISLEEREAVAWWIDRNMSWLHNTDESRWSKLWPKEWEQAKRNYIIKNNL